MGSNTDEIPTRRSDVWLGFFHFLPVGMVILGYAGVFGVLAVRSGLSAAEASLMSLTVFAGASQFIALPMIQKGATVGALTAMALLVNLRHLLYGLGIGRKFAGRSVPELLGISLGIVDETYAFALAGPGRRIGSLSYFAGTALCGYTAWNLGTLAGAFAAEGIGLSETGGLDFVMTAVFIAMVGSSLKGGADWLVVALSTLIATVTFVAAGGYWHLFTAGALAPLTASLLFRERTDEN